MTIPELAETARQQRLACELTVKEYAALVDITVYDAHHYLEDNTLAFSSNTLKSVADKCCDGWKRSCAITSLRLAQGHVVGRIGDSHTFRITGVNSEGDIEVICHSVPHSKMLRGMIKSVFSKKQEESVSQSLSRLKQRLDVVIAGTQRKVAA